MPRTISKKKAREAITRLEPWFHNLHLPGGVQTAPNHWLGDFPHNKWVQIVAGLEEGDSVVASAVASLDIDSGPGVADAAVRQHHRRWRRGSVRS